MKTLHHTLKKLGCPLIGLWVLICLLGGCEEPIAPIVYELDREAMMDPEACKDCHPNQYREWAGSMHAYASLDPVFLAINQLGQEETGGELGDFCVQCHAPMAVRLGLTTDGLNLSEVPAYAQGVTCFFCHTAESVTDAHNNPITLSGDLVMRGAYDNPVSNTAHASTYSALLDRKNLKSADLCGSCHDIVTPKGVHLEKTYAEWKESLYSNPVPGQQQTCGNCHMKGRDDIAADYPGVFLRQVHNHMMVGVDVALTPFNDMEAQRKQVERELNTSLAAELCVTLLEDKPNIIVSLENMAAGHSFPSGAALDRRVWVELVAYDEEGKVLFESGRVQEGQAVADLNDPNIWELRDRGYTETGEEAHLFWEVATVEREFLPAPTTLNPLDPNWVDVHKKRFYTYDGPMPAEVSMAVKMRPMGLDVIDYVASKTSLDPSIRETMPTFTLGSTVLTWRAEDELTCIPQTGFN